MTFSNDTHHIITSSPSSSDAESSFVPGSPEKNSRPVRSGSSGTTTPKEASTRIASNLPPKEKSSRRSSNLPAETVEYLKAWMMSPEHVSHPYPTEQEKLQIMADTGIELKQLTNWFVNNRKRYWKPRIEARLQQQQVMQSTTTLAPKTDVTRRVSVDLSTSNASVLQQPSFISFAPDAAPCSIPPLFQQQNLKEQYPTGSINSCEQVSAYQVPVANVVHTTQTADNNQDTMFYLPRTTPSPSEERALIISESSSDNSDSCNEEEEASVDRDSNNAVTISNPASAFQSVSNRRPWSSVSTSSQEEAVITQELLVTLPRKKRPRMVSGGENETAQHSNLEEEQRNNIISAKMLLSCGNQFFKQEQSISSLNNETSEEKWRDACRNARHLYDVTLPSFDEAVELFGFS